ncbi:methyltransferase domain-containing protein [Psychrosphaera sp. 1_MG-2023]|uniref:methyltransferase domain-containing protein n=1 Tax=Psychrosphaera sp. 1_MG-2023 TaxID=3062643 RepID=UPI0026E29A6B|nr:methyltransferase domain-containing protein [Psychrosphaera sp. 1_MG-2023]MDO6719419.1 methyltransferase domain-containing protein [Psychrosphaera sp. 1_MG-2023]
MTINVTRNELADYWDNIFDNQDRHKLEWFEPDVSQTIEFLGNALPAEGSLVFIAGAGTSKLVEYLHHRNFQMVLNDISKTALKETKSRVGGRNLHVYLNSDISKPFFSHKNHLEIPNSVELWIDRATLHFLINQKQIDQYFVNLRQVLKVGGYVMLAQFVIGGVSQCTGLPIKQWTIDDFQLNLGSEFRLHASRYHDFIAPNGETKPYVYALFKRV